MEEGWSFEFPLVGPGGEPIDLWRTIVSHGVASLPPMRVDEAARILEVTLPLGDVGVRTVRVAAGRPGYGAVGGIGPAPVGEESGRIRRAGGHVLRLGEHLWPFY